MQEFTPINSVFIEAQQSKELQSRSSHCGSVEMNLTSIHEDTGSIPALAQWVKDPVLPWAVVWGRGCGSDLVLLWLWHRLAATTPIQPLDWEPPYAVGMAPKKEKKKERTPNSKCNGPSSSHKWVRIILDMTPCLDHTGTRPMTPTN